MSKIKNLITINLRYYIFPFVLGISLKFNKLFACTFVCVCVSLRACVSVCRFIFVKLIFKNQKGLKMTKGFEYGFTIATKLGLIFII